MTTAKKPELGKWGCWRFFAADPNIRPYLPPTKTLNLETLRSFLNQYQEVYIKPTAGYGGRGIIKAWKTANGFAFIHERGQAVQASTVAELLQKVKKVARPGITYIVQKAIQLPKVKGRPFDIRLMMMRRGGKWEYAGMLAKVAGQQSIITNVARGRGYVLGIDQALQQSLGYNAARLEAVKKEMIQVGHKVVHRFDDYKRYWQIGLDLAVDTNGKVWIIEENTGPAHSLFARLPDKTMYHKIKQITAENRGRKVREEKPTKKAIVQAHKTTQAPKATQTSKSTQVSNAIQASKTAHATKETQEPKTTQSSKATHTPKSKQKNSAHRKKTRVQTTTQKKPPLTLTQNYKTGVRPLISISPPVRISL